LLVEDHRSQPRGLLGRGHRQLFEDGELAIQLDHARPVLAARRTDADVRRAHRAAAIAAKSTEESSFSAASRSTFAPCASTRRDGSTSTVTSVVGWPLERSVTANAFRPLIATSRASTVDDLADSA